jgi:hypothetical protein
LTDELLKSLIEVLNSYKSGFQPSEDHSGIASVMVEDRNQVTETENDYSKGQGTKSSDLEPTQRHHQNP